MSEKDENKANKYTGEGKATDRATLEARLMSPMVPKTELEWYAKHKIDLLEAELQAAVGGSLATDKQLDVVKKAVEFYEDWAELLKGSPFGSGLELEMFSRASELRSAFGLEAEGQGER